MSLLKKIVFGLCGILVAGFALLVLLIVISSLSKVITLDKVVTFLVDYRVYIPYLIPHIFMLVAMWWLGWFRALREGCRIVTKPVRLCIYGATIGLYALSSWLWVPLLVNPVVAVGESVFGV